MVVLFSSPSMMRGLCFLIHPVACRHFMKHYTHNVLLVEKKTPTFIQQQQQQQQQEQQQQQKQQQQQHQRQQQQQQQKQKPPF
jgi:isoaspartyl peptidase/L-asparaginase-like protein (Ntn-hydrolase superfamily)